MTITRLLLEAWALGATLQLVLYLIQQRTRNAGIVDVGWTVSFGLTALWFAARTTVCACSWGVLAAIVLTWSVRLATHLIARGTLRPPEEGRYADLRARWGDRASRNFFVFFQAQAALTPALSTAFVVPFVLAPHDGTAWLRALGASLSIAGILGESIADVQLARHRRTKPGTVCDTGLWAWSRHPNYFFEWCYWCGLAVYSLAFGSWGLIGLVGQALIITSIFGVTGIPPTEAQSLRSKGDAYREYQKRVSRFIPMPPKSRGDDM